MHVILNSEVGRNLSLPPLSFSDHWRRCALNVHLSKMENDSDSYRSRDTIPRHYRQKIMMIRRMMIMIVMGMGMGTRSKAKEK